MSANPRFRIVARPGFRSVAPGSTVSYYAETIEENAPVSMATSFSWSGINDSSTMPFLSSRFFKGPNTRNWLDAKWDFTGRHQILLKITHPDAESVTLVRREWVDSMSNIASRQFDPHANDQNPGPNQILSYKEIYHQALLSIAEQHPPSAGDQEKHDKTVQESEEYIGHLKFLLNGLSAREGFAIDALYVDNQTSQTSQLSLWLVNETGPNRVPKWTLIDWTNPNSRVTSGRYEGSGDSHQAAIQDVLSEWDSDNRYPDGLIKAEIKIPKYVVNIGGEFETDGASFWDSTSSILDYIAIGAAVTAGVVTLFTPIPGSRVVSAAIWTSIFTSTTAATINIVQRHSEGQGNLKEDVFDGLSIVGNLFAGAGSLAWKSGALFQSASKLGPGVTKAVLIGQVGTDGLQGVLLGVDFYSAFQGTLDDPTLSPDDRLKKILEIIRSAALAGALTYVSLKGSKKDLDNLSSAQTPYSRSDLETPGTVIDLDRAVEPIPVRNTSEVTVQTEFKGQVREGASAANLAALPIPTVKRSFQDELEELVQTRTRLIINKKADISAKIAIATSRSGVEELNFKTMDFENLGGKKPLALGNEISGVVRQHETFTIKGEANVQMYMDYVEVLYLRKEVLHGYTKVLIEGHISRQTGLFSNWDGLPGLHAEVQSLNSVFNELERRGIDPRTYDLNKIDVMTYKVQNTQGQGKRFVACPNCRGIIPEGVNIISDRE